MDAQLVLEVSDADKNAMRALVRDAIVAGRSDDELKTLRDDIFDFYHQQIPRDSIASIAAYVRYPATQAINAAGLWGKITRDELIFSAEYMDLSVDKASGLIELQDWFRVNGRSLTVKEIATVLQEYSNRRKDDHEPLDLNAPLFEEPETVLLKEVERQNLEILEEGASYEINYGNPVKVLWRETALFPFVDRTIPTQERTSALVVCMPSKYPSNFGVGPRREVDGYLDMGFLPENIIAVENNPEFWPEFERNCHRLGIQPVFGDIKDILANLPRRPSVVTLDYLGPLCPSYLDALGNIIPSSRCAIMFNAMGKREGREIQDLLRIRSFFGAALDVNALFFQGLSNEGHDPQEGIVRNFDVERSKESLAREFSALSARIKETPCRELRNDSYAQLVMEAIGRNSAPNPYAEKMPEGDDFYVPILEKQYSALLPFERAAYKSHAYVLIQNSFAQWMGMYHLPFERSVLSSLAQALTFKEFQNPIIHDIERWGYQSGASSSHSPFESVFLSVENSELRFRRYPAVFKFMGNIAECMLMNEPAIYEGMKVPSLPEFFAIERRYKGLPFGSYLKGNHAICGLVSSGKEGKGKAYSHLVDSAAKGKVLGECIDAAQVIRFMKHLAADPIPDIDRVRAGKNAERKMIDT